MNHLQDLFAATYQPISMQVPGWQTGPPHGMGFHLQYNTAAVSFTIQYDFITELILIHTNYLDYCMKSCSV